MYHATTEDNAKRIKEKGFEKIKPIPFPLIHNGVSKVGKKPGTLGYGLYGFSDLLIAQYFLEEKFMEKSSLLSFKLNIKESYYLLDLTKEEDLLGYNKFKAKLLTIPLYREFNKAFSNQGYQSSLEGALLEHYIKVFLVNKLKKNVIGTKAMTVTQIKFSKGSYLANAYEYCIRNVDTISDIKIANEGRII